LIDEHRVRRRVLRNGLPFALGNSPEQKREAGDGDGERGAVPKGGEPALSRRAIGADVAAPPAPDADDGAPLAHGALAAPASRAAAARTIRAVPALGIVSTVG
jgi:hypothetical protein